MGITKFTILCDNTASSLFGIMGEHGFSMLIEKDNEKLLFDTGQGFTLTHNAAFLGIDLEEIKHVVISHGHYDHTGGLESLLNISKGFKLFLHPDCFLPKYASLPTGAGDKRVFIGMKYSREYLMGRGAEINMLQDFQEIIPGVFFSGEIPQEKEFSIQDTRLLAKIKDTIQPDPFKDDISLLVETDKGPVVVLGCAHAGVVNILRHLSQKTGLKDFYGIVGGTHLGFFPPGDSLNKILEELEKFSVKFIAPCHCTGPVAAAHCYHRFKERFEFVGAGWSREF